VPASPGVTHGQAFVFLQKELEIPYYQIEKAQLPAEIKRFEQAIAQTRGQISKLRAEVAERLGEQEAQIFDAHLLVLEDIALIDETIRAVTDSGHNVEYCYHTVAKRYMDALGKIDDEYIKERMTDIRDVTRRMLHNLLGHTAATLARLSGQRVIVSEDLTPSETASLDKGGVLGLVTNVGSQTSHAVIMARSLQIPAVVGLHDVTDQVENGDYILVDGYEGLVILHPTEPTLARYGRIQERRRDIRKVIDAVIALPAETKDGTVLRLVANINGPEDLPDVRRFHAEGVGLYRTESLFIQRQVYPPEEEQFDAYRAVVEGLRPQTVVVRTLDLGGDKQVGWIPMTHSENNPFMGFRAIRFCLEHRDLFREQLRAILRASAFGTVKIMYPMISGVNELIQANVVLTEAKRELRTRNQAFDDDVEVGAMIEIPSAAWTADQLADHCSFFSIGTNDLIQYLLAVDRVNDRVAHLYEPSHPAVLRAIKHVVDAARTHGLDVCVCGEMAGDPLFAPLLFGFGVDDLSLSPSGLPEVKYLLRSTTRERMEALAASALQQSDPQNTLALLRRFYAEHMGELARPDLSP
jgi:phosphotransferase system enzyme I (PtsI)